MNWLTSEQAQKIAEAAHADRRDKLGYEEIDHIRRVADGVSDMAKPIAWVHDAVEDGLLSFRQLYSMMHPVQFEALLLVTRDGKQTYMDYVRSIRDAPGISGDIAREIKIVDLSDNVSRPCPPEMMGMREPDGRYGRALAIFGEEL